MHGRRKAPFSFCSCCLWPLDQAEKAASLVYSDSSFKAGERGGDGFGSHAHAFLTRFSAVCSRSASRESFGGGFEAGRVRHVQHLGRFIDALHEATQGSAGAEFDEASESLSYEVAHTFLPTH